MKIDDPEQLRAMRSAFEGRDRTQDGRFVVAVTTTGIYCRPSCPARRPRRENTEYFADGSAAEDAGYRPCKRCRPNEAQRDLAAVKAALAAIGQAGAPLPLDRLAALSGYSPSHFQRVFKRCVGLSPAAYGRALRSQGAAEALSRAERVSDAIYDAGFEAPSRFYEMMEGRMAMTPSAWVKGGAGATISWAVVPTSIAPMLVAATEKGVCCLSFNEDAEDLRRRFPKAELVAGGPDFASLLDRVVAAVERPGTGGDIPLDVRGTAFQEAVWAQLRKIPPGETRSYSQIAAAAGKPKAVRAAGSANGANHVAVLIPCHRVVRGDGSLGGYAYGQEIKAELLRREEGAKDGNPRG